MNTVGLGAAVALILLGLAATGGIFFSWQKAKAQENKPIVHERFKLFLISCPTHEPKQVTWPRLQSRSERYILPNVKL